MSNDKIIEEAQTKLQEYWTSAGTSKQRLAYDFELWLTEVIERVRKETEHNTRIAFTLQRDNEVREEERNKLNHDHEILVNTILDTKNKEIEELKKVIRKYETL